MIGSFGGISIFWSDPWCGIVYSKIVTYSSNAECNWEGLGAHMEVANHKKCVVKKGSNK